MQDKKITFLIVFLAFFKWFWIVLSSSITIAVIIFFVKKIQAFPKEIQNRLANTNPKLK
jgi:hypothetical protein